MNTATLATMMRRADPAISRHTGTLVPNQPHVSAQCRRMCRSKPLIRRECAGVPSNEREASHA